MSSIRKICLLLSHSGPVFLVNSTINRSIYPIDRSIYYINRSIYRSINQSGSRFGSWINPFPDSGKIRKRCHSHSSVLVRDYGARSLIQPIGLQINQPIDQSIELQIGQLIIHHIDPSVSPMTGVSSSGSQVRRAP